MFWSTDIESLRAILSLSDNEMQEEITRLCCDFDFPEEKYVTEQAQQSEYQ